MSGLPIITPLDAIVGKHVQRIREDHGETQEKLAEILDCSVALMSQLERGKRAWSNKWIWAVVQHYNIEPGELFGGATREDMALIRAIKERVDVYKAADKKP